VGKSCLPPTLRKLFFRLPWNFKVRMGVQIWLF
jgi:hypothetical protein